jgi:2-dehydropantoate 2-reductase
VPDHARLVFGELDGRRTPRMEAFPEACRAAGINAELSDDIAKALWTKFLFICAWGGVGTLTRQPIGAVLRDSDTRELFVRVMEEAVAVARAKGVALDPDIVERQVALADSVDPGNKPSMLVDLERGNRLELEWLNGAVARIGRQVGVDTPVNHFIYAALKLLANGRGD